MRQWITVMWAMAVSVMVLQSAYAETEAVSADQQPALTFDSVVTIAAADASRAEVVMNAFEDGKVDVAYKGIDGGVYYVVFDIDEPNRELKPEKVCGLTHGLYGVGRDADGRVIVGANNSKQLIAWTRTDESKWVADKSGVIAGGYYGAIGGFAVSPKTSQPAFYAVNADGESVFAERVDGGQWRTTVLDREQTAITRGDVAFGGEGQPIVAYQRLGKPAATRGGSPFQVGDMFHGAYAYFPLSVAGDQEGRAHAGVSLHTGLVYYFQSNASRNAWTKVEVDKGGGYGDSVGCDIAVNADGSSIAFIYGDRGNHLTLATSVDSGATWLKQPLAGAQSQFPAAVFDRTGRLFVAWRHPTDGLQLAVVTSLKP